MSDLNCVQLCGRVVRDASLKTTQGGLCIAEFSIAVNRTRKDEAGNYVQEGHFFPLALYGEYAEKMQPRLTRGRRIIVEGYVRQDRWETGDGSKRSATAIGVTRLHLLPDAKPRGAEPSPAAPQVTDYFPDEDTAATDGDIADITGMTAGEMQELYGEDAQGELYDNGLSAGGDAIF